MRGIGCAWAMGVLALWGIMATAGWAEVSTTGDTYDDGSAFYAGCHGNTSGSLTIDAGSEFSRSRAFLGYALGSTGAATITGAGSKWTNSGSLYVGRDGSGTLTVSDGGMVSAKTLYASLSDLYGNGTITASGVVLDADLTFDATHGSMQSLAFGSGGTLQFTVDGTSDLGIGYKQSGSLRIAEGRSVSSTYGYVGYNSGSTGAATITGTGTTWTNSEYLWIGYNSGGTLRVEAGAQVSDFAGVLGTTSGSTGEATITGAGSRWTNSRGLWVGSDGSGTLRVEAGGQVSSTSGTLGFWNSGSAGEAIVAGAGSKWTNSDELYVGYKGSGTLRIEAGGEVSNTDGYMGDYPGSTGVATVSGAGSKWTNSGSLFIGHAGGSGTLRVEAGGQVSNGFAYLSSASGFTATAIISGTGSKWMNSGWLGIGWGGSGTLRVEAGAQVSSTSGHLGESEEATGTAIISGVGSNWTNSGGLTVGNYGSGTLRVEGGAQVSSSGGTLGYLDGSTGAAIITGAGSTWTNSGSLLVGYVNKNGRGTLTVSDGGQVTAKSLSIGNNQSAVRLHVSSDRMVVLGNASAVGTISNAGRLSLLADAFLPSGTYRPIGEYADRSLSWSGIGSTLTVGGSWDRNAGTFTVGESVCVDAGTVAEVVAGMRVVIRDPGSGDRAGVSFGAMGPGCTLRALPLTESERAGLMPQLDPEETILSGWDFAGRLAGAEALVSLEVGPGAEELRLWRVLSGGQVISYTPAMMTYDSKGIVSFTVDPGSLNFGAYALSGVVPEPTGLGMLMVAAGVGLVRRRARCGRMVRTAAGARLCRS